MKDLEFELDSLLASAYIDAPSNANFDNLSKKEQLKNSIADRLHREGLVRWVKWNVSLWLFATIFVVSFCGFGLMELYASILIALLTTTTVNILGLAYIVLKGFFK